MTVCSVWHSFLCNNESYCYFISGRTSVILNIFLLVLSQTGKSSFHVGEGMYNTILIETAKT